MKYFLILFCFLISCAPTIQNSELDLVGGEYAKPGEFSFAVRLNKNCTAARIGLYEFLTAAHCVINEETGLVHFRYMHGEKLLVENTSTIDKGEALETSIFYVDMHPSYVPKEVLEANRIHSTKSIDLSVVVVRDLLSLKTIPLVNISDQGPSTGANVILAGYGCEKTGHAESSGKLKTGIQKIASASDSHYFTRNKHANTTIQLCAGDSGGPLLQKASGAYFVIGVNQAIEVSDTENIDHLLFSSFTRISKNPPYNTRDWVSDETRPNPQRTKPNAMNCTTSDLRQIYKGLPEQYKIAGNSFSVTGVKLKEKIYFGNDARLNFSISDDPGLRNFTLEFSKLAGDQSAFIEFSGDRLRGMARLARGVQEKDYHVEFIIFDIDDSRLLDSMHLYLTSCQTLSTP